MDESPELEWLQQPPEAASANVLWHHPLTHYDGVTRVSQGLCRGKSKEHQPGHPWVCLWFPEAEEVVSHGSPDFRVKGKIFATYVINHHGDGRIALWLNVGRGAQDHYVRREPKHYFVPPYVGPRGWLGVNLDKGISWKTVATLVRAAYEKVAPSRRIWGTTAGSRSMSRKTRTGKKSAHWRYSAIDISRSAECSRRWTPSTPRAPAPAWSGRSSCTRA